MWSALASPAARAHVPAGVLPAWDEMLDRRTPDAAAAAADAALGAAYQVDSQVDSQVDQHALVAAVAARFAADAAAGDTAAASTAAGYLDVDVDVPAWRIDPAIRADAAAQAFPFVPAEVPTVDETRWSARVQAAIDGMDAADQDGLDRWMAAHAAVPTPHVLEVDLVAAWETRVRDDVAAREAQMTIDLDTGDDGDAL